MVKIERLQECAASDKCLLVMGKRLFINLYEIILNKLNTILFYLKMAQFLFNIMYSTSYFIKYLINFLFSPILAY